MDQAVLVPSIEANTMKRENARIIPFIVICLFISYIDRATVGFTDGTSIFPHGQWPLTTEARACTPSEKPMIADATKPLPSTCLSSPDLSRQAHMMRRV